jgi:hypothetical protein
MQSGLRTLVWLGLCAAAAGAALAHYAIDIVGDFAVPRDSYDYLPQHESRDVLTGLALVVAVFLAARGLRVCCEIAHSNRGCLIRPRLHLRDTIVLFAGAIGTSVAAVPAMEFLDGRLDGVRVTGLADAFGGSLALGLVTTIVCAAVVAAVVYAIARWLISRREAIVAIIATLLRPIFSTARPSSYHLSAQRYSPRRRRTPHALCLSKRGPPVAGFAPAL